VGTGSLVHDVNRWWQKVRGKEDPYLKIGEVNDRTKPAARAVASSESRVAGSENEAVTSRGLQVAGENQSAASRRDAGVLLETSEGFEIGADCCGSEF
jgi:hypothetical protein